MRRYELIDTTDNDCHDEGSKEEMQRYADERNADDARYNASIVAGTGLRVKKNRWVVKPEGFSAENFKG